MLCLNLWLIDTIASQFSQLPIMLTPIVGKWDTANPIARDLAGSWLATPWDHALSQPLLTKGLPASRGSSAARGRARATDDVAVPQGNHVRPLRHAEPGTCLNLPREAARRTRGWAA